MSDKFKSPFLVYQDFLSHKLCDQILDDIMVTTTKLDQNNIPVKTEKTHNVWGKVILEKTLEISSDIEERYGITIKSFEDPMFQHYPESMGRLAEEPHCENAKYLRKKWVKCLDRDLTGIIWLKDYQNEPPIDLRQEVYGGKLEFPTHDFSLVPQKGTLVIYPAGPHFISAISQILIGNLYQIRLQISHETEKEGPFFYQPENFLGNYFHWFRDYV